jgi:oligopeptide/dipeptide ABC transporter ATP-binding protein
LSKKYKFLRRLRKKLQKVRAFYKKNTKNTNFSPFFCRKPVPNLPKCDKSNWPYRSFSKGNFTPLDVSIQSQILNLLKDLQDELGLTYLFIAHDLAVVEFFCDVIAVMYMGRIVEQATSEELYKNPLHPYTRVLMSAIPQIGAGRGGKKEGLGGEVPEMSQIPQGCPFHPRCSVADSNCLKQMPGLKEVGEEGHLVSCWKC